MLNPRTGFGATKILDGNPITLDNLELKTEYHFYNYDRIGKKTTNYRFTDIIYSHFNIDGYVIRAEIIISEEDYDKFLAIDLRSSPETFISKQILSTFKFIEP